MFLNRTSFLPLIRTCQKQILDTLFPIYCLGCQNKGTWICSSCIQSLPIRLEQRCPACLYHITPLGQTCFACLSHPKKKPSLDGLFAASVYRDAPLLSHAIHTFKYRFIPDLAEPLGLFLVSALQKSTLLLPDFLVPVPLHSRRLRFRGFNQSELLANTVSRSLTPGLELPVLSSALVRKRHTKPQMKTDSREERQANLKNAFTLTEETKSSLRGKSVWLIDDVATTGTTLEECALVLKQAGAKRVFGIVVAR